jgi:hypothetical protein
MSFGPDWANTDNQRTRVVVAGADVQQVIISAKIQNHDSVP